MLLSSTLYTYAFVIMEKYKSNGYAKMLKRVYISWAKKREYIKYITGHVREGIANRFDNNIEIINHIKDWQGTGMPFEYYRRSFAIRPQALLSNIIRPAKSKDSNFIYKTIVFKKYFWIN